MIVFRGLRSRFGGLGLGLTASTQRNGRVWFLGQNPPLIAKARVQNPVKPLKTL